MQFDGKDSDAISATFIAIQIKAYAGFVLYKMN